MVSAKWSDRALADIEELDQVVRVRVLTKVSWLEENIPVLVPDRLHHELRELYKLRIGDYRVVYSFHKDHIVIETVGHRWDVYKQ